jgi:hypothetical protein
MSDTAVSPELLVRLLTGLTKIVEEKDIHLVSIHGHFEDGRFVMRALDSRGRWWAKACAMETANDTLAPPIFMHED